MGVLADLVVNSSRILDVFVRLQRVDCAHVGIGHVRQIALAYGQTLLGEHLGSEAVRGGLRFNLLLHGLNLERPFLRHDGKDFSVGNEFVELGH